MAKHTGGKPMGSKLVTCGNGHLNYILPGVSRLCSGEGCRRTVKLVAKTTAAKRVTKPKPVRAKKPTKKAKKPAEKRG